MNNSFDHRTVDPANLNGFAAGRVFAGGLLGLGVAICLNSSILLAEAERLPDSTSRSISVAVWTPIESVASPLKLTWPREIGDRLLGRAKDEQQILTEWKKTKMIDLKVFVKKIEISSVAIGGINLRSFQKVKRSGVDMIAMSSELFLQNEIPELEPFIEKDN